MGKKVIRQQGSSKISKKDHSHSQHHHQQFNSLIKVLRPKVYITDSSSFKKLVQDLTGNGTSSKITSSSTSQPLPQFHDHHHRHQVQLSVPEPSVLSTEAPTASSDEFCYNNAQLIVNEEDDLDDFFNNQIMRMEENDTVFEDILACDYDQIQHLESLLFDEQVEKPSPFYEQEISIYDYDFSKLIN